MAPAILPAGTRLYHYRIVAPLGAGAMGAVYRARDEALDRDVALKVMLPALLADARGRERFVREARAAAAVMHPNVACVHFVGEVQGALFIASELALGGSLADRLARTGKLGWRETAALGAQIARGLAAIHEAKIVHRDLKPANVLLDQAGRAKVADFGVARQTSLRALTQTGELVGTPAFMAPEQADGKAVDARADLYSLGALVFMLVTGQPPFVGEPLSILSRVLLEAPPAPRTLAPETPAELDALILRLLAKDRAARGKDASQVARELEAIAEASPEEAPPRGRRAISASGVAILVLGVASAVLAGVAAHLSAERDALAQERTVLAADRDAQRALVSLALESAGVDALLEGAEREHGTDEAARERAAELVEKAFELDPLAVRGHAGAVERLRSAAAATLSEEARLDASGGAHTARVRVARRRLLRARLLQPKGAWPEPASDLRKLGASRDRAVALAARPWLVPGFGSELWDVDALIEQAKLPAALDYENKDTWGDWTQVTKLVKFRRDPWVWFGAELHLEAVLVRPELPFLWFVIGDSLRDCGRFDEALLAGMVVDELRSDRVVDARNGQSAFVGGRFALATSYYSRMAERGPMDWRRLEAARVFAVADQREKALSLLSGLDDEQRRTNLDYWCIKALVDPVAEAKSDLARARMCAGYLENR